MQSRQNAEFIVPAIARAEAAAEQSRALREKHRWKSSPGAGMRAAAFAPVLKELAAAAKPLRKLRGMEATHPEVASYSPALADAIKDLRAERRRLNKMLR